MEDLRYTVMEFKELEIHSMDDLKKVFHSGVDYQQKWLLVHYSKKERATLTDIRMEIFAGRICEVPFLIIIPGLVIIAYGKLDVAKLEDIDWLETTISSSVTGVQVSQKGNTKSKDYEYRDEELPSVFGTIFGFFPCLWTVICFKFNRRFKDTFLGRLASATKDLVVFFIQKIGHSKDEIVIRKVGKHEQLPR